MLLAELPDREWFAATMRSIIGRPRAGVPFTRTGHYFVTRNDGSQNQDVSYVADSLSELLAGGRVLVDPNTLSADGTSALTSLTVSTDGALAATGSATAAATGRPSGCSILPRANRVDDVSIQTKFSRGRLAARRPVLRLRPLSITRASADGTETTALPAPATAPPPDRR